MSNRIRSTSEQDPSDSFIDRALASYTPANARPGLEDRVRARIAAAEQETDLKPAVFSWRWVWASGIVLAAVLLLLGVLRFTPHRRPSPLATAHTAPAPRAPQQVNASPQLAATQIAKLRTGIHHGSARTPNAPQRGPALQRGPSQQQLIAQLLANNPGAIAIMARDQDRSSNDPDKPIELSPIQDKPLEIEPIQIKPLDESPAPTGGR